MEEEREAATLLLLGRDQLVGEPRVLGRKRLELLDDRSSWWRSATSSVAARAPAAVTARISPTSAIHSVSTSQSDDADNRARDDERDEKGRL